MTDENMRKKIAIAAARSYDDWVKEDYAKRIQKIDFDKLADALIAAGIGDVSSEKAMRELAEAFHREKCAEYDLLNYQMQKSGYRIAEAEHRAEKTERALHCLARSFAEAMCKDGDTQHLVDGFIKDAYRQAEKEFAEKRKDG